MIKIFIIVVTFPINRTEKKERIAPMKTKITYHFSSYLFPCIHGVIIIEWKSRLSFWMNRKKEHTKRLFNSFLNYLCLIWFQSFCNLRYINSNDLFCFITIIMLFFREPSLTCTPLISLETLEWVAHRAAGYTAIIILLFFSMTLLH